MQENIFLREIGTIKHGRDRSINNCEGCGKILSNCEVNKCQSCCKIGIPRTQETKEKISIAFSDEKHPLWKGDLVSYTGLHLWVKRNKPIVERCERCNKIKKLCLANISGEYKRDINDYEWLCYLCHNKEDRHNNNMNRIFIEWKRRLQ